MSPPPFYFGGGKVLAIALITLKGVLRDRVLHGILVVALLFVFVPSVSSLSMRQVSELSITLSLSLLSSVLLLVTVFLGATTLGKDIERRFVYSALGLPISRGEYLLGRFLGIVVFLIGCAILFAVTTLLVVWYSSGIYPSDRAIQWGNILVAIGFILLQYLLLTSLAFLFASLSTSFFLPFFGTISVYFVGCSVQGVYEYIHSSAGAKLPVTIRGVVEVLYFLVPNFSAFDLKIQAVYGLQLDGKGLLLTFVYFLVYAAITLSLSVLIFRRRELV